MHLYFWKSIFSSLFYYLSLNIFEGSHFKLAYPPLWAFNTVPSRAGYEILHETKDLIINSNLPWQKLWLNNTALMDIFADELDLQSFITFFLYI